MQKNFPLVTIGLPVFNGQVYIEEAIQSVLNQSYANFELIISDNGSTDNTQAICEHYSNKDGRIQYYRLDKNYGASKNYNRTFELSKGKYFKWLAHDDKLHPSNLEKSIAVLEANKDVVLCGCEKVVVNAYGKTIDTCDYSGLHLDENDPVIRYKLLLNYFSSSFSKADFVFGLIRSSSLARTNLIGNYSSSDFTLLAELILKGKFQIINEPLFIRRFHHGMSMSVYNNSQKAHKIPPSTKVIYKSHAEIAKWYDPSGKVRYIPHFKWLNELNRSIKENKFKKREYIKLYLYAYKWFYYRMLSSIKNRLLNNKTPYDKLKYKFLNPAEN